eukprot:1602028-Amphidinium_carterae.1
MSRVPSRQKHAWRTTFISNLAGSFLIQFFLVIGECIQYKNTPDIARIVTLGFPRISVWSMQICVSTGTFLSLSLWDNFLKGHLPDLHIHTNSTVRSSKASRQVSSTTPPETKSKNLVPFEVRLQRRFCSSGVHVHIRWAVPEASHTLLTANSSTHCVVSVRGQIVLRKVVHGGSGKDALVAANVAHQRANGYKAARSRVLWVAVLLGQIMKLSI